MTPTTGFLREDEEFEVETEELEVKTNGAGRLRCCCRPPLYSITQVYLSPEVHLGEASMSTAVRPRIESAVIKVTPTMKGDPRYPRRSD